MELIRINKYLKDKGICSRRKADEFIAKGYVKINGIVVTELGYKVNPALDRVEVSAELKQETANFRYLLLNKPKGYICSKSTMDGKNIFELVPAIKNLTYAGRLDKDSQGLVILSDDGKFIYKVAGAEFAKEKEYLVRVDRPLTKEYLVKQANGSIMLDGKILKMAKVEQISQQAYKIILTEGVNRQLRRMAQYCDYRVTELKRIRIDKISDINLDLGKWRELTKAEIRNILAN